MYYPVSDEALEALVCLFKRFVFPEKTTIIHAGKQDRKVYFYYCIYNRLLLNIL